MKNKVLPIFLTVLLTVAVVLVVVMDQPDTVREIIPLTKSWEKAVPHQEVPEGLQSMSAKECGTCHVEHYEEWKTSTHANAWTDMQFQAELAKETSPFLCINCHIPLQNQQEYIVKGLIEGDLYNPLRENNPHWDYELQQEGITCAACHVRNDAIIGPTGGKNAPHKTIKNPKHLSETLCISCHNAVATVTPQLACSFETGDEWKAGPYFGEKNCISCHMPELERSIAPGMPERTSHYHSFTGSGIPKYDTLHVNMLKSLSFNWLDLKSHYKQGNQSGLALAVKNEFAGHRVPTGDPERFILIEMKLYDGKDKIVKEETFRIGEKWEWYPEAKKIGDNNLNPGESRVYNLSLEGMSKGSYTLKLNVTKHRMTKAAAEHNGLDDHYPRSIVMHTDEISFSIN